MDVRMIHPLTDTVYVWCSRPQDSPHTGVIQWKSTMLLNNEAKRVLDDNEKNRFQIAERKRQETR